MANCNYKVDDKVKVRSDLSEEHGASPLMIKQYAGKVVTISDVDPVMPLLGVLRGHYHIEEDCDHASDCGFKYIWCDAMFEGLAEGDTPATPEVKPANPMPKLTNGMFGKEDDGDIFVVVGDKLVYKSGLWESVSDMESGTYFGGDCIVALYEANCFEDVKDGTAELIWKRDAE